MNLIECLLRIADTGFYTIVLDMFKHGIQRSGELIFLGLLKSDVNFHLRLIELRPTLDILDCLEYVEARTGANHYSNISGQQSQCQCTSELHVELPSKRDDEDLPMPFSLSLL